MRVVEFDGSPEEYAEYLKLRAEQQARQGMEPGAVSPLVPALDEFSRAELQKFIKRVLNRILIPQGQRDLYGVLYEAGDRGLSRNELIEKLQRSPAEVAGVVGTMGRRIHQTPGARGAAEALGILPADRAGLVIFFDLTPVSGQPHYRMRLELRLVLESEGLI
jgi:hypothetical protein